MFTYSLTGLAISVAPGDPVEVEECETTSRSAVYQVLGAFFSAPDRDHFDKAREGMWVKELAAAATLLPFPFEIGEAPLAEDVDPDGYAAEHKRVLDGRTNEAAHLSLGDAEREVVSVQLRREYEYFGLGVTSEERRPDELSTECDFMQYMSFREAVTGSERLRNSYRRAQRDFLEQHLLRWVPAMVSATAALQPAEPFAWAIGRLGDFVHADHLYVAGQLGA